MKTFARLVLMTVLITSSIASLAGEPPKQDTSGTPTSSPEPVEIKIPGPQAGTIPPGTVVYATGYLVVPSGSYSSDSATYSIWLQDSQWSKNRLNVDIPGGQKRPNTMYFERGPRIQDDRGNVLSWIKQGDSEVYITEQRVRIKGTWLKSDRFKIKTIIIQ